MRSLAPSLTRGDDLNSLTLPHLAGKWKERGKYARSRALEAASHSRIIQRDISVTKTSLSRFEYGEQERKYWADQLHHVNIVKIA